MAETSNIDDEWEQFCQEQPVAKSLPSMIISRSGADSSLKASYEAPKVSVADADKSVVDEMEVDSSAQHSYPTATATATATSIPIPMKTPLHISTQTRLAYFHIAGVSKDKPLDLHDMFWKIPVMKYHIHRVGVLKKQMKFKCKTEEDISTLDQHIKEVEEQGTLPVTIHQMTKTGQLLASNVRVHTSTDDGNASTLMVNTYKHDIRKVSIGTCKRDIINPKKKNKSAFYNCFVLTLRLMRDEELHGRPQFYEMHVKVFNTGKVEIPGLQNSEMYMATVEYLHGLLSTITELPREMIVIDHSMTSSVLINSNFNVGYHINREKLYKILCNKYKLSCNYDACRYPGIQCQFYYDTRLEPEEQTGVQPILSKHMRMRKGIGTSATPGASAIATPTSVASSKSAPAQPSKKTAKFKKSDIIDKEEMDNYIRVSIMLFRTGSVLIVGKCEEPVLRAIHGFLCKVLDKEYHRIHTSDLHSLPGSHTPMTMVSTGMTRSTAGSNDRGSASGSDESSLMTMSTKDSTFSRKSMLAIYVKARVTKK